MNLEVQSLRRAEAATLRLRGLYESYGYRKYRMGRFEEYMDRRRDLIVEIITQLMVPDAR